MALLEVREMMLSLGFEPGYQNGAAVKALIKRELPLMRATAAQANIQAE